MILFYFRTFFKDGHDIGKYCINKNNVEKCDKGAKLKTPSEGWSECTEVNFSNKERYRYCIIKSSSPVVSCILEEILDPNSSSCTK